MVVLSLLAAGLVLGASGLAERARELVVPPSGSDAEELTGEVQPTLAIVTHAQDGSEPPTRHIAVLAHDRETGDGTVLFVPPSTVADVPGHGSFGVGEAFAFGDSALVGVTLENLLGIRIDEVLGMPEEDWAVLLDRVGGFEVDVPSTLTSDPDNGGGQLRFEAGPQRLDGPRLAEYLMFRGDGETELDVLPRLQRVLRGLFASLAEDASRLDAVFADGAPMLETDDPDHVRGLFSGLAEASRDDRLVMLTLPVSPLGSDRTDAYRVDAERLRQLVDDRLAAARPTEQTGAGRSLQILNGVGTPGVGQVVAELLQPGGYRVLLTGNASDFDHTTTRIVIYDDAPEQLEVARDIRERLGVGEIERSGMPQSVVDVTIIVGADLLSVHGGEVPSQAPGREVEQDDEDDEDEQDDEDDGADDEAP